MGLICIENESLLVYSKGQKVSASYCLPFQHSREKNQPVGGSPSPPPPPGLLRVKTDSSEFEKTHMLQNAPCESAVSCRLRAAKPDFHSCFLLVPPKNQNCMIQIAICDQALRLIQVNLKRLMLQNAPCESAISCRLQTVKPDFHSCFSLVPSKIQIRMIMNQQYPAGFRLLTLS